MDHFIFEMAEIYKKIKNGTASADERSKFETETLLSCMNYNILMDAIKRAAKE